MPIPKVATGMPEPRQLVRERVLDEIRNAILTGVLLPGERLDEASLRAWLGVSATPIRQALHTLVLEELVESAPQAYTIVAAPRPDDVMANMQAVGVLLIGVTQLALPTLDEFERETLAADADMVAQNLVDGDIAASSKNSGTYFLRLIEHCPNKALVALTRRAGTSLGYHIYTAHQGLLGEIGSIADAYRSLAQAMRQNDFPAIATATRQAFLLETKA